MPGPMRPKGTEPWPEDAIFPAETTSATVNVGGVFGSSWHGQSQVTRSSSRLIALYESGHTGTFVNEERKAAVLESQKRKTGFSQFAEVSHRYGFADKFAGTLCIPYIWEMIFWPGCLPGAAQERGDCVSHAASGAQRTTIAGDIATGLPDQATNKMEGIPKVDPVGIKNGVTSSEFQYWWRGYNGDGWDCPTAAEVSLERGCLLRNNYEGVIDMRDYSGSLAGKYGSRKPPDEIANLGKPHQLHGVVEANTFEELRDACGSIRGINSCGGQGYSSTRDKYGYSPRRGSWSHGFKISGTDDRPEIVKIFGEPIVLGNNNWGGWNDGPRDIYLSAGMVPSIQATVDKICGYHVDLVACDIVNPQTGCLMIPKGCWWTKWSEIRNRDFSVYAGIKGWDRPNLPDYGGSII